MEGIVISRYLYDRILNINQHTINSSGAQQI